MMNRRNRKSIFNLLPIRKKDEELSRSELIRQRRQEHTDKASHAARNTPASKAIASRPAIPTSERTGNGYATSIANPRRVNQQPARRKVSVSTGAPYVEMQLPAMPILRPGWRLLSGFILISLLVCMMLMLLSPDFHVTNPQINGLQRIPPADIIAAAGLNTMPIFLVDTESLQANIVELFPELSQVMVNLVFPSQVVIDVVERTPVIAWKFGEMTSWIDQEGNIFPARGEADIPLTVVSDSALPLENIEIDGYIADMEEAESTATPAAAIPARVQKMAMDLLAGLLEFHQLIPEVGVISFSQLDGYGWQDENNWNVYFGHQLTQLDQKIAVYRAIKQMLLEQGIQPSFVNVAHVNAPFYRMEH